MVLGDLNVDFLKWNTAIALQRELIKRLKARIVTKVYLQKIEGITHQNRGTTPDTLIDHVWVNDPGRFVEALNIMDLTSDHNHISVHYVQR